MINRTRQDCVSSGTPLPFHFRRATLRSCHKLRGSRDIRSRVIVCMLSTWLMTGVTYAQPPEPVGRPAREVQKPDAANTPGEIADRLDASSPRDPQRQVIWCFVGSRDQSTAVSSALQSGLITHVAIFSGNRVTSDTLDRPQTREAIRIAKQAKADGVELILVRFLWQTQPARQSELDTLLDADYYVQEISQLRKEARKIGAKYVGFDTEAYGPTPIHTHFRSKKFSKAGFDALVDVVDRVVRRAGKVDFILPAGSARRNHPYMALARMGKQRISEGTFYDNMEQIRDIKYPYEIAGMYMNVTKKNERHAWLKYFLAEEVFGGKSNIWRQRRGLMIWPREHRAAEVAGTLVDFAGNRSRKKDDQPGARP